MRLFGSIEARHGVNEPGYKPPVDDLFEPGEEDGRVGPVEIIGSLLVPIAGVVFGIMRFADDEVGPGFACLLTGLIGAFCWAFVVAALS